MPDLEAAIRTEAGHARRDPALLPAFEALRLNLGTADTEQATLLDAGTWLRIEADAAPDGPVVWGLDLGTSSSMSAIAAFWIDVRAFGSHGRVPRHEPNFFRARDTGWLSEGSTSKWRSAAS